jgi:hypothetical protein
LLPSLGRDFLITKMRQYIPRAADPVEHVPDVFFLQADDLLTTAPARVVEEEWNVLRESKFAKLLYFVSAIIDYSEFNARRGRRALPLRPFAITGKAQIGNSRMRCRAGSMVTRAPASR